jgi:hypothetical protein
MRQPWRALVSYLPLMTGLAGLVVVMTIPLLDELFPPEFSPLALLHRLPLPGLGPLALLHRSPLLGLGPLAWLVPLALYDLRRREVPNITFVAVPCGLAALGAAVDGVWTLGALVFLIVAASERNRLPKLWGTIALVAALSGSAGLLMFTPFEQSPGVIAIIGFWLAYELGWWAGADALAAMTLAILWPEVRLLVSLAAAHLAIAVFLHRGRAMRFPRKLSPGELEQIGVAGMPAIALGAAMFVLWKWWAA